MIANNAGCKAYCNVLAIEKGLDPAGYAGYFEDAILVETSLPWNDKVLQESGKLPQEALNLMAKWLQRYHETGEYPHLPLLIAPDETYSRQGYRRVIYYQKKTGEFADFEKDEYLVPESQLGSLLWALFEDKKALGQFEEFHISETETIRDILVCTHGTVDVACAKFGFPLYKYLRQNHASESLRVWRVSHFGGHVFAPTLMDMPTGHYWAFVEEAQAQKIIERSGDVTELRLHYRGWAGMLYGFAQAAERELWQQYDWEWFSYYKTAEILAQDSDEEHPAWAEVLITFSTPDGEAGSYRAKVETKNHITTYPSTDNEHTYDYPQYVVTRLEKIEKGEQIAL